MISVHAAVSSIIKTSPFLEEGLERGIISYSALAREIKPRVEESVFKRVTSGSIIMALKRIADTMEGKTVSETKLPKLGNITLRSNLVELTYLNSPTILDTYRELFLLVDQRKDVFCSVSQGIKEITIITTDDIRREVEKMFIKEHLIARLISLSSITISLPRIVVDTPGSYYTILKKLAWENINIIEVLSTYTELTIVFSNDDVDKAFSVLKKS